MTFKKIIQKIHLWFGFIAGLVLVVNLLPASIFAFNQELKEWWYKEEMFVSKSGSSKIPLSVLKEKVITGLKNGEILSHISIANNENQAYAFGVFKDSRKPGFTYFSEADVNKEIYVNPYTGEILGEIDLIHDWIKICEAIHRRMLLHYNYGGHWIIAYASLMLIFSILTGMVLWFPRSKAALKQRFTFKRNVRWRRRNYDVHNVGGFYTHLLILFLAVTGLLWSFDWWKNGFYKFFGEDYKVMSAPFQKPDHLKVHSVFVNPLDIAFDDVVKKRTGWTAIVAILPEDTDQPQTTEISFYLKFNTHSAWDESDQYVYSATTGGLTKQVLHEHKSAGVKWDDSNYAFHTGSIYGLPTKILMCVVTLFCASLPITGFLIWVGKRKKKKKPKHS